MPRPTNGASHADVARSVLRDMEASSPDWGPSLLDLELGISPLVPTPFAQAAAVAPARRDPLTLDLDGDGLETTGIDPTNPIHFDHDGDGVKTATGWVRPDDGLLVLDRNGNGTIDTGAELFGDATPLYAGGLAADGFAALAQEDTNGDGRVDALDARFAQLRLWQDANQDGISQAAELKTLAAAGIAALLVARTEHAALLPNGNQIADLGGYLRSDGSSGTLGATDTLADIDLASHPFFSQFADRIPPTAQTEGLPDLQGAGQVRNLRDAASLDTEAGRALAAELAAYAAQTTRAGQLARLDALIAAWAATSEMAISGSGAYAGINLTVVVEGHANGSTGYLQWVEKLGMLERFNGRTLLPVPAVGASATVDLYGTRQTLRRFVHPDRKSRRWREGGRCTNRTWRKAA